MAKALLLLSALAATLRAEDAMFLAAKVKELELENAALRGLDARPTGRRSLLFGVPQSDDIDPTPPAGCPPMPNGICGPDAPILVPANCARWQNSEGTRVTTRMISLPNMSMTDSQMQLAGFMCMNDDDGEARTCGRADTHHRNNNEPGLPNCDPVTYVYTNLHNCCV